MVRRQPKKLSQWEREMLAAASRARTIKRHQLSALTERDRREAERLQQQERDARRYARDGDQIRAAAKEKYRRQHLSRLVSAAKLRAHKRGLPFNLTVEDIHIPEFCPVLGLKLCIGRSERGGVGEASPSLDRLIPSLGYVVGNVRVISWRANRLKCDASLDEVEKIAAYMRGANG